MGSKTDIPVAEKAEMIFRVFGVEFDTIVMSAHRNPNKVRNFALSAEANGYGVVIAIAGLSAHLPGVLASLTTLPVIGVPVETGPMAGEDALWSIVQMPPGIPVACMGIGNAKNAGLFAVQILGCGDSSLNQKFKEYRLQFGDDEV